MELGNNLKTAREESGKKVYDIEKATGIKHEQIYRWESNKNVPSIIQCIKLADFYGISLDELVGREFGHEDK
ncbi:MAG: helix-turn-helix transcriptional regulator [Clostridiales bacterium]|nr:helix-turn-helix transcriptional regulator [Clostridiales bacterium]